MSNRKKIISRMFWCPFTAFVYNETQNNCFFLPGKLWAVRHREKGRNI